MLLDSLRVRVMRRPAKEDLPRADANNHRAVGESHAKRCDHVLREEPAADKRVYVQPNELLPDRFCDASAARRC